MNKMKSKKNGTRRSWVNALLVIALTTFLGVSCAFAANGADSASGSDEEVVLENTQDGDSRPDGWGEESHSNDADPNYGVVFPDDEVNTLTITIDADDWQAMLDDLNATYGEPGSGRGAKPGDGPADRPDGPLDSQEGAPLGAADRPANRPGDFAGRPGDPARPGEFGTDSENPIWVAATVEFEGTEWTTVGVRFKGNSSLMSAWNSGSLELPFKLDFDEFEDDNPAIKNQRFYGFKQLSLSNNTNDATFMRDAVVSDVMAEAGIINAETAFYELLVDYGEGPVNFGLYTMIEVIDDTAIERVLGADDGNIYEGDGTAASLAAGTSGAITESFQKENNRDEADWSDIEALYDTLHSGTREADPATWRSDLESIFDVDTFLQWLAINTVIENWDTYGAMTHNFYLYNNPETGQLSWIPWDHNEALIQSNRGSMTLAMDRIGAEWPLISFLLADDHYHQSYVDFVDEAISGVFDPAEMEAAYQEMATLIGPYAEEKVGANTFARAVQELIDHTYSRVQEAQAFLAQAEG